MAQELLVHIELQNTLLGKVALGLEGVVEGLDELAAGGFFCARPAEAARKLHGDRAGATRPEAFREVVAYRSQHADRVDAHVPEKATVFHGKQGVAQLLGDLLVRNQLAAFRSLQFGVGLPLVVVEDHLHARRVLLEYAHLRGIGKVDHRHAGSGSGQDDQNRGQDEITRPEEESRRASDERRPPPSAPFFGGFLRWVLGGWLLGRGGHLSPC